MSAWYEGNNIHVHEKIIVCEKNKENEKIIDHNKKIVNERNVNAINKEEGLTRAVNKESERVIINKENKEETH